MKLSFTPLTLLGLALVSIVLFSCNNSEYPGYKKTNDGLYYNLIKHDDKGRKAEIGDVLMMDMIYKNDKDSIIFDSHIQGRKIPVPLTKPTFKGGLEEGFAMLAVGDSASFIVSADSLFQKTFGMQELPKEITKGSMLTFFVKVDEIKTKAELEKMREERQAEAEAEAKKYKEEEKINLDKYLADNKITTPPTASGLIYIEKVKGKGAKVEKGKKVVMNYVGRLLDGTVFDTSIEKEAKANNLYQEGRTYEPFEFTVGNGEVIQGWDEALPMMNEGGKAVFIIPSEIAYGEMAQGPIKPYSTLVFEVELLKIK
ncbi:MAG: FKBP-type peptidyl-prolyl cis-trans isomerase [Bacteroidia bacterium]|nr:FKBP-type peptidyl-prolyl cis-trans isomerase [Bacteroidia bacterium]MCZ2247220.1 FKBP-type peptidyl-prolyl cis-trans isomerase [Bacteroidia bacterium]